MDMETIFYALQLVSYCAVATMFATWMFIVGATLFTTPGFHWSTKFFYITLVIALIELRIYADYDPLVLGMLSMRTVVALCTGVFFHNFVSEYQNLVGYAARVE